MSVKLLRGSSLISGIAPPRPGFCRMEGIPEGTVRVNLGMVQADIDSLFGEILAECRGRGIAFARMANSALRKRDSGEELSALERKAVSLFDKIEALEILRETRF